MGAAVGFAVGAAVGAAVAAGAVAAGVGVAVGLGIVAATGFLGGGATIAMMTISTTKAARDVSVHHFHDLRGFHKGVFAVPPGGAVGGGQGGGAGGGSCDIFRWPETTTAAVGVSRWSDELPQRHFNRRRGRRSGARSRSTHGRDTAIHD